MGCFTIRKIIEGDTFLPMDYICHSKVGFTITKLIQNNIFCHSDNMGKTQCIWPPQIWFRVIYICHLDKKDKTHCVLKSQLIQSNIYLSFRQKGKTLCFKVITDTEYYIPATVICLPFSKWVKLTVLPSQKWYRVIYFCHCNISAIQKKKQVKALS